MLKDLEYYRNNAEENYLTTPISVLRYIDELESCSMKAYVIVNTLSNYKNVNDKELRVKEFLNSVVACYVPEHGFDENGNPIGELIIVDFSLKEVKFIKSK